jgi:hypothetical protein
MKLATTPKQYTTQTDRKFNHMQRSMGWIWWAKAPLITHVGANAVAA